MAELAEELRREYFENEFRRWKRPAARMEWLIFMREGQLQDKPKEEWGGYIRSETEHCYKLWREEQQKMKLARREGEPYEINFMKIWDKPYN
jgi:hypothetical protein